jgi:RNA polymerase sigma-70 factor, ECF subfamily
MPTLQCNAETATKMPGAPGWLQGGNGKAAATVPTVLTQIEACIPALRRYAVALLHTRGAADELVRDCLERALDMLHTRSDATDVRAWLFATMHTLFMSRMRRHRVRLPMDMLDATGEAGQGRCPDQKDGLQCCDLLRGLEHLPGEQRSVVLLVSVEDLSYAEAARVLGMPARMVISNLAGGRERLRQYTHSEEYTHSDECPAQRRVKWAATPAG